jgi:hypothetical protein
MYVLYEYSERESKRVGARTRDLYQNKSLFDYRQGSQHTEVNGLNRHTFEPHKYTPLPPKAIPPSPPPRIANTQQCISRYRASVTSKRFASSAIRSSACKTHDSRHKSSRLSHPAVIISPSTLGIYQLCSISLSPPELGRSFCILVLCRRS